MFQRRATSLLIRFGALAGVISLGGCAATPSSVESTSETRAVIAPLPPSPLVEYAGFLWDFDRSPEALSQRREAQTRRREDLIAQCMRERGFDYVPYLGDQPGWFASANATLDLAGPQFNDPEWVEQYGFGIFANPSLAAFGRSQMLPIGTLHFESDPNYATFNSLSETEQHEWRMALVGLEPWESDDWGAGCRNMADEVIWQDDEFTATRAIIESDEFAPLNEAMGRLASSWLEPNVTEEELDYLSCMAAAGYPELMRRFEDTVPRWDPVLNAMSTDAHQWRVAWQLVGEFHAINQAHQAELREAGLPDVTPIGEPIVLTPAESLEMADLQRREIAMALADFDCRASTNMAARQRARQIEAETVFVNDHRAALVALRDAHEQRG